MKTVYRVYRKKAEKYIDHCYEKWEIESLDVDPELFEVHEYKLVPSSDIQEYDWRIANLDNTVKSLRSEITDLRLELAELRNNKEPYAGGPRMPTHYGCDR